MRPILIIAILLIVPNVQAQTTSQGWQTYTVKGENFSVAFPNLPAVNIGKGYTDLTEGFGSEITLGTYHDGVVYLVYVLENRKGRKALDRFMTRQFYRYEKTWDRKSLHEVTLDGLKGKAYLSADETPGIAQFFTKGNRLYQFAAAGAPLDDPRIARFFSSVSMTERKDAIEVEDGPGEPFAPVLTAGEKIYKEKEVDKTIRLGMRVGANYSENGRRQHATGPVILKCVFAANGEVTNIKVIKGMPWGLTEKAIEAAKKVRFIPARKDGQFVSVRMEITYNFGLYDF